MTVETSGCGFLPDRRPKILFERHKFSELTHHRFDAAYPDISNRTAGGYGASGANQYVRLERAMALDTSAALRATSWGLGQVMGFNAQRVGFASVEDMVEAFTESEDRQITAMAAFIRAEHLDTALAEREWAKFAAGYNGANYQANDYDGKLARYHARYLTGPLPDLLVRAVQMGLSMLALPGVPSPGKVDGWYGENTQHAVTAFQLACQLPPTGRPDAATMAELRRRLKWPGA
jgi:peptidoglycan hydrolase-like protein with peptidoglycan-binding domain